MRRLHGRAQPDVGPSQQFRAVLQESLPGTHAEAVAIAAAAGSVLPLANDQPWLAQTVGCLLHSASIRGGKAANIEDFLV